MKENLFELRANDELMFSPVFSDSEARNITIYLSIRSLAEGNDWVNLEREIEVSIRHIDDVPSIAEVVYLTGCGGGAYYRYFSTVPLNTDYGEYNVTSVSTDADYYTLEPGESEIFVLDFECDSTGLYAVDINIPITYQGEDEIVTYSDLAGIICPGTANMNYGDVGDEISTGYEVIIYQVEQYEWTGSGYRNTNP